MRQVDYLVSYKMTYCEQLPSRFAFYNYIIKFSLDTGSFESLTHEGVSGKNITTAHVHHVMF